MNSNTNAFINNSEENIKNQENVTTKINNSKDVPYKHYGCNIIDAFSGFHDNLIITNCKKSCDAIKNLHIPQTLVIYFEDCNITDEIIKYCNPCSSEEEISKDKKYEILNKIISRVNIYIVKECKDVPQHSTMSAINLLEDKISAMKKLQSAYEETIIEKYRKERNQVEATINVNSIFSMFNTIIDDIKFLGEEVAKERIIKLMSIKSKALGYYSRELNGKPIAGIGNAITFLNNRKIPKVVTDEIFDQLFIIDENNNIKTFYEDLDRVVSISLTFDFMYSMDARSIVGLKKLLSSAFFYDRINVPMSLFNSLETDDNSVYEEIMNTIPIDESKMSRDMLKEILTKFFITIIKRVYTKDKIALKIIPTIIGNQSAGKSAFLEDIFKGTGLEPFVLCGQTLNISNRDERKKITSSLIVEFAESTAFMGRKHADNAKRFISACEDSDRAPYATREEKKARMTGYIYTSNNPNIVNDTTGNSRYFPIELISGGKMPRTDKLDMKKFWGYLVHLYKSGYCEKVTKEMLSFANNEGSERLNFKTSAEEVFEFYKDVKEDPQDNFNYLYTKEDMENIFNINLSVAREYKQFKAEMKAIGIKYSKQRIYGNKKNILRGFVMPFIKNGMNFISYRNITNIGSIENIDTAIKESAAYKLEQEASLIR